MKSKKIQILFIPSHNKSVKKVKFYQWWSEICHQHLRILSPNPNPYFAQLRDSLLVYYLLCIITTMVLCAIYPCHGMGHGALGPACRERGPSVMSWQGWCDVTCSGVPGPAWVGEVDSYGITYQTPLRPLGYRSWNTHRVPQNMRALRSPNTLWLSMINLDLIWRSDLLLLLYVQAVFWDNPLL